MGKLKLCFLFFLLLPLISFADSETLHISPRSSAPYACDPSHVGTFYSSFSNGYFCNGSEWVVISALDATSCSDCITADELDETDTYAFSDSGNTFVGSLTGDVTGNVTGNTTGTHTGAVTAALNAVTGTDSLTAADCGVTTTVTAGIDTHTITLPEASTVLGCTFKIVYIGASGGALVDISPLDSDADGIIGSCTLASSVVSFSGTADADIGLTKATGLIGDWIALTAVSASQYAVTGCQGIWANN